MDVMKMLADLRQEREQIEEAIVTLERLARGRRHRQHRGDCFDFGRIERGNSLGFASAVCDGA